MGQATPGTTRFHHIENGIDHLFQINRWPSAPPWISFSYWQQFAQLLPSIFANIARIPFPFILFLFCTHDSYIMLVLTYITTLSWVRFQFDLKLR